MIVDNKNLLLDVNNELKDIIDKYKTQPEYPDIDTLTVFPYRDDSFPVKPALYIQYRDEDIVTADPLQTYSLDLIYVSKAVTVKVRDVNTMKVIQSLRRLLRQYIPKHLKKVKSLRIRSGLATLGKNMSLSVVLFALTYEKTNIILGRQNQA